MLKKIFLLTILAVLTVPVAMWAMQEQPAPRVEITGVNATELPEVFVTANVYSPSGQPISDLTAENFQIVGELADQATITNVQNIRDDNLPYSVVLVIDVSDSMEIPFDQAQAAAQAFIDSMQDNTSVAIVAFGTEVNVVQDFTTDKDVLRAAVESLHTAGRTALYQAAFDAVEIAANAPTPRRAVILLSDGAEYGNASRVGRGDALEQALQQGVSFYTIGLGYGIDRSYLIELAENTNARFIESPNADELTEIYGDLAGLLQSQYVVDVNADLPSDGTVYGLELEVTTPFGTASTEADLRAPIPVPIVALPVFDTPFNEVTEFTPDIRADQDITGVTVTVDGGEAQTLTDAPYTISIDPETLSPGRHQLAVSATDADGDTGSATGSFEVAVLPPHVNVISNLNETVENVQTVILDVTGQTLPASATYSIDGEQVATRDEVPFSFDVDPLTLTPGDHTLTIDVSNQGGGVTTVDVPFTVATLSPYVVVVGLEEGQVVDAPTEIEVDVIASQSPVTEITVMVNNTVLDNLVVPPEGAIMSTTMLDPMLFPPGNSRLEVNATNETGGEADIDINFSIEALPPVTLFENLSEGDVLDENRTVGISFQSQTPVNHVAYFMDEAELAHRFAEPWDIELDVLAIGPGEHTLRVAPMNTVGQSSSASITFTISDAPSLTATALAPTPTATVDVGATETQIAAATLDAAATIAANTQVAETATERSLARTGTAEAQQTGIAETAAAQSTSDAQGTTDAQMNAAASSTLDAQSTMAAQAELNAQGTAFAQSTRSSRATENAESRETRSAQSTQNAQATLDAQTGEAETAQATQTAISQATEQQQSTAAAATLIVEESEEAAQDAQQTATAEEAAARMTMTAESAVTSTEVAVLSAQQATDSARDTQAAQVELNAQGTANAQGTRSVRATDTAAARSATREAQQTATGQADASATALDAQLGQTATQIIAEATRTGAARATQTGEAENALGTQTTEAENVQASETAEGEAENATRESALATRNAESTLNAQATIDTQLTAIATEEVTETEVAQNATLDRTPRPTATPQGTLVPIEVESQAADLSNQAVPLIIAGIVILVIVVVVYLIWRGSRRKP